MRFPACSNVDENLSLTPSKQDNVLYKMRKKGIWIVTNLIVFTLLIGAVDYSTYANKGWQYIFKEKKINQN